MQKKTAEIRKFADLSYLKKISEGSDEFIKEMIEAFLIQTPEIIGELDHYLNEQKWAELRGLAHKIKPSVDFMGLIEIKETVRDIEKYPEKKTNLDELPDLVHKMKTVCQGAIDELKEELKKYS
jgi:HPt (histidine-containing phosphotransfer) domain-containing protein